MFLFYLEIVNRIVQASITISQFPTASSNHVGGETLSLCDSLQPLVLKSSQIFIKMWKAVVHASKVLKSLSEKPWDRSKEILLIYYFSLPDEGGENKNYQVLSFSVYFWNF